MKETCMDNLIQIINQNKDDCVKKIIQLELSQKKCLSEVTKLVNQKKRTRYNAAMHWSTRGD